MSSAEQRPFVTVDDYLIAEEQSEIKSEYVDGWIRGMSGATTQHNVIVVNALVSLAVQLRGRPCRPFGSDMKLRICRENSTRFYYPDVTVICDSNRPSEVFQDRPVVVIEVLSPSTRAADLDEKLTSYLSIDSLQVCLMIEQHKPMAIALRRTSDGFLREVYEGIDGCVPLPEIDCQLAFVELYAQVEFTPNVIQELEPDYEISSTAG